MLMQKALEAALSTTRLQVHPNPRVGAALKTSEGTVLSAAHQRAGLAHAEAMLIDLALKQKVDLSGAELAVTLEPCSHQGRTGPCVELLKKYNFSKIEIGSLDPHPKVSGQGSRFLKEQGFNVVENILRADCEALNKEWLQAHRQGHSYVILKLATSADGKWAAQNGESQWVSSMEARQHAHLERAQMDVILCGRKTFESDNPALTARDLQTGALLEHQPKVFVLSRHKFVDLKNSRLEQHPLFPVGAVKSHCVSDLKIFLHELLYQEDGVRVLLESGPFLSQAFLDAGLVNEIHWYWESQLLGGQGLDFVKAFNDGALPGLELKILEMKQLSPTSVFFKLAPIRVFS